MMGCSGLMVIQEGRTCWSDRRFGTGGVCSAETDLER